MIYAAITARLLLFAAGGGYRFGRWAYELALKCNARLTKASAKHSLSSASHVLRDEKAGGSVAGDAASNTAPRE